MAGKRIIVFSLFALAAITLALFASSGTEAQSYKPGQVYTLTATGGGVASDSHNIINIDAPDYNYEDSSMFSLVPLGMVSNDIPGIGAGMGALSSSSTVGLVGGPCNTALPPIFPLYEASVDNSPGNELDAAAMYWLLKDKTAFPIPTAAGDPELEDYLEGYPSFLNDMLDPDGPGGLDPLQPRARYAGHDFVASMNILIQIVVLEPGELMGLPGIYAQMGPEVGTPSLVVLNNPVSADEAPGSISDFCTPLWTDTWLYATTTDNPNTTGVDESGTIAQSNPPAGTGILASGTHIARNYSRSERDADGDGHENDLDPCHYSDDSGWDPRANCTGIPLTKPGDIDCDGLPTSCDPDDSTTNSDQDLDGYSNAQDICPLVIDGCQHATCHPTIYNPAWANQADDDTQLANADLGPGPDSIGNACDDSDNDGNEDGAGPGTCNDGLDNGPDGAADELDADCAPAYDATDGDPWGSNPGTGLFYHALPWAAVCVGAADVDTDGYCDGLETALGSNPAVTGSTPESLVIDVVINAPGGQPSANVPQSCSDGVDNDGDTKTDAADNDALGCDPTTYTDDRDHDGYSDNPADNCAAIWNPEQDDTNPNKGGDACATTDRDNDTFNDYIEGYLPTDAYDDCPDWKGTTGLCPGPTCDGHDAWPLDNNVDKASTVVGDVLNYVGNTGQAVGGDPILRRLDLNADGSVTVVGDVLAYPGNTGIGC